MTDLEYRPGTLMKFEPINVSIEAVLSCIAAHEPQVVILEPGDATRYTLLLVAPGAPCVSGELRGIGIPLSEADHYLFVSKITSLECPGTFVPFGRGQVVGFQDVTELSSNEWSQRFLSWWFTSLCEAL